MQLADRVPGLTTVAGDVSTGMLDVARQAVPSCQPVVLDAASLPLAD